MKILITGPPGCGITTISKSLQSMKIFKNYTLLNLTDHIKKNKLYDFYNEKLDTHEFDEKMVNENIKQFIKNENNLIIETHTPSVLEDIDLDLIFYLKRPIKDIISVYKVRGYSQNKIQENIDCINLDNVLDECIDFLRDPKNIQNFEIVKFEKFHGVPRFRNNHFG